ncbi:hypothetical protein USB125703_01691 [Pseudoclavibacter triregionum]|nr:hypothetical protein USB125703_01691 [Pseudoclavibacter triregionum]
MIAAPEIPGITRISPSPANNLADPGTFPPARASNQ